MLINSMGGTINLRTFRDVQRRTSRKIAVGEGWFSGGGCRGTAVGGPFHVPSLSQKPH